MLFNRLNVFHFCFAVAAHLVVLTAGAQQRYDFGAPLTIPLVLKGTYGEIRTNHFHSGIDLKTEGRVGLPVLAVANGYVSRIKVDEYGFGRAIYITHDNGYVSVYAHLHKFCEAIEQPVYAMQKSSGSFSTELFPAKNKIRILKGDTLAFSGNSGGSAGPHLHFEIRNAKTEIPLDPLDYGFVFKDDIPPVLSALKIYSVNDDFSEINTLYHVYPKTVDGQSFFIPTAIHAAGKVAVAFSAYDKANADDATLGLKKAELFCNGKLIYAYRMKAFSFEENKLVNGHIDYATKQNGEGVFERCFVVPGNSFSQYYAVVNKGIINMAASDTIKCELVLTDAAKNKVVCKWNMIKVNKNLTSVLNASLGLALPSKTFYSNRKNEIQNPYFSLFTAENSFYRNFRFPLDTLAALRTTEFPVVTIGDVHEPLKKSATLSFPVSWNKTAFNDKLTLVKLLSKDRTVAIKSNYNYGAVTGRISEFGRYTLAVDTMPPVLSKVTTKTDTIYKCRIITIDARDDLSGIKYYNATLNGLWILSEYDYKNESIICYLKNDNFSGKANLKVNVTDGKGNKAVLNAVVKLKH